MCCASRVTLFALYLSLFLQKNPRFFKIPLLFVFFFLLFSKTIHVLLFWRDTVLLLKVVVVLENIDVVCITERLSSAPVIERATFVYVFDFSRGGRFNR